MVYKIKFIICISLWLFLIGAAFHNRFVQVHHVDNDVMTTIQTPMVFSDQNEKEWNSIGHYLTTTNFRVYVLEWGGYGGYVYIAKDLISSIIEAESQGKTIIIRLAQDAYSAHSDVVCYASEVQNPHNKFLMFHADSEDGNIHRETKATSDTNGIFAHCVQVGILSQHSLDVMWQGYEVYVNKTQVWYKVDPRRVGRAL